MQKCIYKLKKRTIDIAKKQITYKVGYRIGSNRKKIKKISKMKRNVIVYHENKGGQRTL